MAEEQGRKKMSKCVCRECGGENVVQDATVSWDKETGTYEVDNVFDKTAYCPDCESETSVDWIELTEQETLDVCLWHAARNNDLGETKTCLAKGADVNARDKNGWTLLYLACWQHHPAMVRLLLEAGADVGARMTEIDGRTCLEHVQALSQNIPAREEIIDLFREHAPDLVMEAFCTMEQRL